MRRSLILDVIVRAEFHSLLVVALYLLFVGHNSPGGGFSGGLVAGSALALRFVSLGPGSVRRTIRVSPTTVLGIGLLLSLGTTIIPLLTGNNLLDHGSLDLHEPLLGDAHMTTAFTFDCGVFLVVVGLVAFLLEAFGGPADEPIEVPPGEDRTIGGSIVTIIPALTVAILFSTGTYLILQRTLTRIILGVGLIGNGANLLLLVSAGPAAKTPLIGSGDPAGFTDPVPQALALTAIVITFGLSAFLLALAYRSWQVTHDDEVEDDVEDRRIAKLRGEFDPDIDELTHELEELEDIDHDEHRGTPPTDRGDR